MKLDQSTFDLEDGVKWGTWRGHFLHLGPNSIGGRSYLGTHLHLHLGTLRITWYLYNLGTLEHHEAIQPWSHKALNRVNTASFSRWLHAVGVGKRLFRKLGSPTCLGATKLSESFRALEMGLKASLLGHDGSGRHLWRALHTHRHIQQQMGKKRTHAETKDGPSRPAPDKSRVSATHDKKDARKNGEAKSRLNLVSRTVACAPVDSC